MSSTSIGRAIPLTNPTVKKIAKFAELAVRLDNMEGFDTNPDKDVVEFKRGKSYSGLRGADFPGGKAQIVDGEVVSMKMVSDNYTEKTFEISTDAEAGTRTFSYEKRDGGVHETHSLTYLIADGILLSDRENTVVTGCG